MPSCGFHQHWCKGTRFLSRYRNENDYCVEGARVTMRDDGSFPRGVTSSQKEAIALYELEGYADFLKWHSSKGMGASYWTDADGFAGDQVYQGPSLKLFGETEVEA